MKSSFFADLVTGISGFLFCLSLSIVLILHFRPLYVQEIKDQKLSSLSSMSETEILEQYDALIHYNSLFYRGELHFPSLPMSEEGRIHFSEVKKIFDAIQLLLIFSTATFFPLAFFRIQKRRFVFSGSSLPFLPFWPFLPLSVRFWTGMPFLPLFTNCFSVMITGSLTRTRILSSTCCRTAIFYTVSPASSYFCSFFLCSLPSSGIIFLGRSDKPYSHFFRFFLFHKEPYLHRHKCLYSFFHDPARMRAPHCW